MGNKCVRRDITPDDVEKLKLKYREAPLEYLKNLKNYGDQEFKELLRKNNMGSLEQLQLVSIFQYWETRQEHSEALTIACELYELALKHPFLFSIPTVIDILQADLAQRKIPVKQTSKASNEERERRRSSVYTERLIFNLFMDPLIDGRRKTNNLACDCEFSNQNKELFGTGNTFRVLYSKWLKSDQGKVSELILISKVYEILQGDLEAEDRQKELCEYLSYERLTIKYQTLLA